MYVYIGLILRIDSLFFVIGLFWCGFSRWCWLFRWLFFRIWCYVISRFWIFSDRVRLFCGGIGLFFCSFRIFCWWGIFCSWLFSWGFCFFIRWRFWIFRLTLVRLLLGIRGRLFRYFSICLLIWKWLWYCRWWRWFIIVNFEM